MDSFLFRSVRSWHRNLRRPIRVRADHKRPEFDIGLNGRIGKLAPNQSLHIKDRIRRVHCGLVFCRLTHETFDRSLVVGQRKCNVRRGGPIALVIRENIDLFCVAVIDADAGIRRSQVDSNCDVGHGFLITVGGHFGRATTRVQESSRRSEWIETGGRASSK